jgi:hypothetical protein
MSTSFSLFGNQLMPQLSEGSQSLVKWNVHGLASDKIFAYVFAVKASNVAWYGIV